MWQYTFDSIQTINFFLFSCRLVVADTIELSDNKSVKSAFGSFIDKTADVFLVLQPLNVDSDVGEYSHAVSHET